LLDTTNYIIVYYTDNNIQTIVIYVSKRDNLCLIQRHAIKRGKKTWWSCE